MSHKRTGRPLASTRDNELAIASSFGSRPKDDPAARAGMDVQYPIRDRDSDRARGARVGVLKHYFGTRRGDRRYGARLFAR